VSSIDQGGGKRREPRLPSTCPCQARIGNPRESVWRHQATARWPSQRKQVWAPHDQAGLANRVGAPLGHYFWPAPAPETLTSGRNSLLLAQTSICA
jgi:hypothetical protein